MGKRLIFSILKLVGVLLLVLIIFYVYFTYKGVMA